jgi:CyaY protein
LGFLDARISSNCRNLYAVSMNETQYLQKIEEAFEWAESVVDDWASRYDMDLESKRMGSVLEVEFESGQKIILNAQAPTQQLWLASVEGAHHFVWQINEQAWLDTRGHGLFPNVFLRHAKSITGLSSLAFLEE